MEGDCSSVWRLFWSFMGCTVHCVPSKTEHRRLNFGFTSPFFFSSLLLLFPLLASPVKKKKKKRSWKGADRLAVSETRGSRVRLPRESRTSMSSMWRGPRSFCSCVWVGGPARGGTIKMLLLCSCKRGWSCVRIRCSHKAFCQALFTWQGEGPRGFYGGNAVSRCVRSSQPWYYSIIR